MKRLLHHPYERLGQSLYNVEIAAGHLVPESVESPVPLLLRRLEPRARSAIQGRPHENRRVESSYAGCA
jgi:hypothetical protein